MKSCDGCELVGWSRPNGVIAASQRWQEWTWPKKAHGKNIERLPSSLWSRSPTTASTCTYTNYLSDCHSRQDRIAIWR